MKKQIVANDEFIKELLKGMKITHDLIVSTMGPQGTYVCIKGSVDDDISFSKDGATVAEATKGDLGLGEVANIGSHLIRKASKKMSEETGDGSTTVSRLTYEICKICASLLTSNQPIEVNKALKEFESVCLHKLENMKKKIHLSEIGKVASLAANNNQEIGKLIQKAFDELGRDGVIVVEHSNEKSNRVEIKKGFCLESGPASDFFFHTDMKDSNGVRIILDNPLYLLFHGTLSNVQDCLNFLERISSLQKSIVILADGFSNDFKSVVQLFIVRRSLKCVLINTPGYDKKEILDDLAVFTGGVVLTEQDIASGIIIEQLGQSKKVTINSKSTIISEGRGDEQDIKNRIAVLNQMKENASDFQKNKIDKRVASLLTGIAIIYVADVLLQGLVENAVQAAKKALNNGILIGAGMDFMQILNDIEDFNFNSILTRHFISVLSCVSKQILENANLPADLLMLRAKESDFQLIPNAINGQLVDCNSIVVPYDVSLNSIKISVLTATKMIFTKFAICSIDDKSIKKDEDL